MDANIKISIPQINEELDSFTCGGLTIKNKGEFTAYLACSEFSYKTTVTSDHKTLTDKVTIIHIVPLGTKNYDLELERKWKSSNIFWNDIITEEIEKHFQIFSIQDITDSEEQAYFRSTIKGHIPYGQLINHIQKTLYQYIKGECRE